MSAIARATTSPRLLARACASGLILLLSACVTEPQVVEAPRPALPAPREMLAQVRAAGAEHPESLEVQPLRDPQVGDLRDRAHALELQADYAGAARTIAQAMTISPGDPELLQQAAEFALALQDWSQAAMFSQQSWERGAKAGSLCRRNFATLRFVHMAHGDAPGVQDATARMATCNIEPPVRM